MKAELLKLADEAKKSRLAALKHGELAHAALWDKMERELRALAALEKDQP